MSSGTNKGPVANNDTFSIAEDARIVLSAATLLANDTDANGDRLRITAVGSGKNCSASIDCDGNIVVIPASNFSGAASFSYTISDGRGGYSTATVFLNVAAVADAASLSVSNASGNEDSAISLCINAALADRDGSESLKVVIGGVPAGASLSAGTRNSDGTWTLTSAQLSGLKVTPPANSDADFTLTVKAITTEASNGSTAEVVQNLRVTVNAVADTPSLVVTNAQGSANTAIALNIGSALTDTDGSESLKVVVSGVPGGATLSAGTKNTDGTWTLTQSQLAGLKVTPPTNSSADFTLTVKAISTESSNGNSATASASIRVTVDDLPLISVQNAVGNEDTAIALNITSNGADSVRISGVPAGATLSAGTHNADGSWTVSAAQLSGLTITPPKNSDADFTLTVSAASSGGGDDGDDDHDHGGSHSRSRGNEGLGNGQDAPPPGHSYNWNDGAGSSPGNPGRGHGRDGDDGDDHGDHDDDSDHTSETKTITVTVNAVADLPTLSVSNASGNSGSPVALNINSSLTDTDGSESLSIRISGLPAGATLSAGTRNTDGSWTLSKSQLIGLTVLVPTGTAGAFDLTVAATSTEAANGNNSTNTATLQLNVAAGNVNHSPVANADSADATEDSGVATTGNVLTNDTDADAGTVLSVANPGTIVGAYGTLVLNADGSYTYTLDNSSATVQALAQGEMVQESFTYQAKDPQGALSGYATLKVSISGTNDAPVVSAEVTDTATEDGGLVSVNLLQGASDVDHGSVLHVANVSALPAGVTLSRSTLMVNPADAAFQHLAVGATQTVIVTYDVVDEIGASVPQTAKITITGTNDAPTLTGAIFAATTEDALPLTVNLLAGAHDIDDGAVLHASTIANLPAGFTQDGNSLIVDSANPAFQDLAFGEHRDISVTYDVVDQFEALAHQTATVTIVGVNDAPIARTDSVSIGEDELLTLTPAQLLVNDSDVDRDTLTIVSVQGVENGEVALDELTGDIHFQGAADYHGPASFTYTVTDGHGLFSTATVNVTINSLNDAPEVFAETAIVTDEDQPYVATIGTFDADNDAVSLSISTAAQHGTVVFNGDGTYTYTPVHDYNGADSFVISADDGHGGVTLQDVSVTVIPVNDDPIANDDTVLGVLQNTGAPITIAALGLLANDSDVDLDDLTIEAVQDASNGSVELDAEGNVVFTPTPGYSGAASFTYTVADGQGGSSTATVVLTLQSDEGNHLPRALPDSISATEDQQMVILAGTLTGNDTDDDGDPLVITSVQNATHGTVSLDSNGNVVFTPSVNYNGPASFSYTVSDGHSGFSTSTVDVSVAAVNDAPVARAVTASIGENGAPVPVSADFSDVDVGDSHTFSLNLAGTRGTVVNNDGGTFSYDPNGQFESLGAGETATDTFGYTVTDAAGLSSTATATITIIGQNDAPVAQAISASVSEDGLGVTLAAVYADADAHDSHSVTINATGTRGTVIDNGNGTFTYNPNGQFESLAVGQFATDTFTYTVSDGNGGSSTATASVTIVGENDVPVAADDSLTASEGNANVFDAASLLGNDGDVDLDSLEIVSVQGAVHGSAELVDGEIVFTPDPYYNGDASFTYTVSDGHGGFSTATVEVLVSAVADAPVVGGPGSAPIVVSPQFEIGTLSTSPLEPSIDVAGTPDGGFITVTSELRAESGTYDIVARRFGADGLFDTEFIVNSSPVPVNDQSPSIAILGDGGLVVAWHATGSLGNDDIFMQRYSSSGVQVGTQQVVSVDDSSDDWDRSPVVAPMADGGFVILWEGNRYDPDTGTSGVDISGRRYAADGSSSDEFRVSADSHVDQADTGVDVVALTDGGFIAVWKTHYIDSDTSLLVEDILGQRFDSSGQAVDAQFVVSSGNVGPAQDPAVVALKDGGFVVSWHATSFNPQEGGNTDDVFARIYDVSGQPVGQEFIVNTDTEGESDRSPTLVAGEDGGFGVLWQSFYQDVEAGDRYDIRGQRFTSLGDRIGPEIRLDSETPDTQDDFFATVAPLADGRFVTTWLNQQYPEGGGTLYTYSGAVMEFGGVVIRGAGAVGLDLNAHLVDTDGSESLSIILTGEDLNEYSLNKGTWLGNHTFSLSQDDLSQLEFTPSGDQGAVTYLTLTATATESSNNDHASSSSTIGLIRVLYNTAPETPANTSFGLVEDGVLTGAVVATDADRDNLTYSVNSGASHGWLDFLEDGSFTYVPDHDWSGQDVFTYTVSDGRGGSVEGTVTLTADAVADAPNLSVTGGDEFAVSTGGEVAGPQAVSMARLSDGGSVAVWHGTGPDGDSDIVFRLLDADGVARSPEILVTEDSGNPLTDMSPGVTALNDGRFVVVWQTSNGSGADIFGQTFNLDGSASGDAFAISEDTADEIDESASAVALADGGFVVVWKSSADGHSDVVAQRFDASGSKVGAEFLVNNDPAQNIFNSNGTPVAVGLGDGGFFVTWDVQRQDSDLQWHYDIVGQRFGADGLPVGGEVAVSVDSNGEDDQSPSIAGLADGGFVVAWDGALIDPGSGEPVNGISMRRFDADGTPVTSEVAVAVGAGLSSTDAAVTGLDDGGFVVAWSQETIASATPRIEVAAQRFDQSGAVSGDVQIVSSAGWNEGPVVVARPGDGYLAAWTTHAIDPGTGEDSTSLFGRTVSQSLLSMDGSPVNLGIAASLNDLDGSETLAVLVSGIPPGAELSAGVPTSEGTWLVQAADLNGLHFIPEPGYIGTVTLTVQAQSQEFLNGATAQSTASISIVAQGSEGAVFDGSAEADALTGGYGNDTLYGYDGDDTLAGNFGDDILNGGAGNNVLTGGSGADVFEFTGDHHGIDTITDFSVSQGDKLDIKDVLQGFVSGTSVLSDFVHAQDTAQGTVIEVNAAGTGSDYVALAVLAGVHTDLAALQDHLIVVHP